MSMLKVARQVLSGKAGRLEDQELEELAKEITKLGFKLGYARAYAYGPTLVEHLCDELESCQKKLEEISAIVKRR